MTVSLIKDPIAVNDSQRAGVTREALLLLQPRVELNFSPGRWAGNGAPLIAFPQGSIVEPDDDDSGYAEHCEDISCTCGHPDCGAC